MRLANKLLAFYIILKQFTLSCLINKFKKIILLNESSFHFQLHIAAANGYASVVEFLLEQGVRTDVKDKDEWEPTHAAACWGHVNNYFT